MKSEAANGPSNRHLNYNILVCYFAQQMSIRKSPTVGTWGRKEVWGCG